MIVVTGAAGFIGSAVIWKLNQEGINDVLAVDSAQSLHERPYLSTLQLRESMDQMEFFNRVRWGAFPYRVEALVHMGACSSTTEMREDFLFWNNTQATRQLADWALTHGIRFIYASSGATYGDGRFGFSDCDEVTRLLQPLNPYGWSKHLFDLWSLDHGWHKHMVGLKFFNVYGPNEAHKTDMASMVFKAFGQVRRTGRVQLFRSHLPQYRDGEQLRDFIYIKDCVDVVWRCLQEPRINGIFNCGSGQARSWNDLARGVFHALGKAPAIDYVPMPAALQKHYQYETCAEMKKWAQVAGARKIHSLEEGIQDYVKGYLLREKYLCA